MREPATKSRRGRPPLPRQRIIDTALSIVAEEGADALGLRRLADRLSSSTSTLYRHVANRSKLVSLVFDSLLGEVLPDDEPSREWEDECRTTATRLFQTVTRHRGAAALIGESVPSGPNALAVHEHLFGVLTRAGFPLATAVRSVATLGRYTISFAIQSGSEQPESPVSLGEVDAVKYPLTATVSPRLSIPLDEEFAFGLDLILRGLRNERSHAE